MDSDRCFVVVKSSAWRAASVCAALMLVMWMGFAATRAFAAANAPTLMFSDLISGPSTGNLDNSRPGQTAGEDGVIVTVWGKNLGTTPGTILVGGVSARVYAWGNATAPANLQVRHGMQMVAFQIPHQLANGATTIQAVVNGMSTNTLPFTVRAGAIYFVKTTGDDNTGNGSWAAPWAKVSKATSVMLPGDTLYIGDGVWQDAPDGDRSTLNLDVHPARMGTPTMPKALIGYPGVSARIGTDTLNAWSTFVSGAPTPATYWTISKLILKGRNVAAAYNTGFRLIGNHVSAPLGDDQTGAIGGYDSANLYVLGNEVTNCGYPGTSKLYHPVYIQSRESTQPPKLPDSDNREVAWNYLHDNYAFDGINFYREGQYSAYMTNTRVHDNFIINQTGRGILIGTFLTGHQNYFYNNVIIRAGLGPPPAGPFINDPAFGYVCVDINAGAVGNPPTTIHFYNNTLYGCGYGSGPLNTDGAVSVGNAYAFDLNFKNNIVVSTGFPFLTFYSTTQRTTASNNVWFGSGGSVPDATHPEIFVGAVLGDPLLADPLNGDARLRSGSSAIDRGSSTSPVPSVDFDNTPRPQGQAIDIGAFEFSAQSAASCSLDIDGDAAFSPLIDGVLIARAMKGFSGASLIDGLVFSGNALRNDAVSISAFLSAQCGVPTNQPPLIGCSLDLDGDGVHVATVDGLIATRVMRGMSSVSVTNDITLPTNATRTAGTDIRAFLNTQCGMSIP